MNKTILKLSLVTLGLFALSIFTYRWDHHRGVDLVSGSEFISSLDIDKISSFSIRGKKDELLVFERSEGNFNLKNFSGYPTSGTQVSDLIYKLLSLTVKEKISDSKKDFKKYGVGEKAAQIHLSFLNEKGKEVLGLYVGNSYKGSANYVRLSGSDQIYLTAEAFSVSLDKKSFVEKNILNLDKEKIERLDLNGEVVITKGGDGWAIDGLSKSKYKDENIEEAVEDLQKVEFDNFFPQDDASVRDLSFTRGANIVLRNKTIYKLALAKDKDRYFLKAHATLEEAPEDIVINPDASNEKLEEVNDIIKVQTGAQNYNLRFKNWVFEISEYEYNKFIKKKNEFSDES